MNASANSVPPSSPNHSSNARDEPNRSTFSGAGWHTVFTLPNVKEEWPEGEAFYGYDELLIVPVIEADKADHGTPVGV